VAAILVIAAWAAMSVFLDSPALAYIQLGTRSVVAILAACAVLLVAIQLMGRLPYARTSPSARRIQHRAMATAVVAAAVVVPAILANRILPVLSARFGWGRYGFPPPVPLTSLSPITDKLGIRLPKGTTVVAGEFIAGADEHLLAVLDMPAAGAEQFLHGQRFAWNAEVSPDELAIAWPPEVWRKLLLPHGLGSLAQRPGAVYVLASVPTATDFCYALIDPSERGRVMVHLYWVRTLEQWNW
jgi:hypothetical protein